MWLREVLFNVVSSGSLQCHFERVFFNVISSESVSMSFRAQSRNLSFCIVALNQISRLRLAASLEMTEGRKSETFWGKSFDRWK